MTRLQGEAAADVESRAQALKVMRGAMSLLTMVAAVLPDAAAEQLEVILQVLATHTLLSNSCLKRERERERDLCVLVMLIRPPIGPRLYKHWLGCVPRPFSLWALVSCSS